MCCVIYFKIKPHHATDFLYAFAEYADLTTSTRVWVHSQREREVNVYSFVGGIGMAADPYSRIIHIFMIQVHNYYNVSIQFYVYKKKRVHTRLNTNFYYIYYYRVESRAFLVGSYACHNLIAPTP